MARQVLALLVWLVDLVHDLCVLFPAKPPLQCAVHLASSSLAASVQDTETRRCRLTTHFPTRATAHIHSRGLMSKTMGLACLLDPLEHRLALSELTDIVRVVKDEEATRAEMAGNSYL